ncbi:MAG TPA: hypothetical protein EYH40_00065 [Desulfurococcales archaeon]|nr:hypothetical protein [Desulfurococcales archaeon]
MAKIDAKSVIVCGIGVVLLGVSIYFFLLGVSLMVDYHVAPSLLAAAIGFACLSASITLLRSWIISRAVEKE